jgi:phosphohistidine swiveling domain-containing protein
VLPAGEAHRLEEAAGRAALGAALAVALGPGPYAVRSSADVEDAAAHSFAGQFRTVLDVPDADAAIEAMRTVVASGASAGVAAYAERVGIDARQIRMAVVVQRMVHPVVSGVAFSRNPLTGLDEAVVEAVPGRGDALVDEGVTPDRWIHRWGDLVERPASPRTEPAVIEAVVRETRRLAGAFGRPIDLEWVHDGAALHVVQIRPIVGLEGIGIFSNRIAREVLPGLIRPLVWSVNVPVVNGAWVDLITEAIGRNDIRPERLARAFAYRAYFDMGALGDVFVALGMPRDSLELLLGLPGGTDRPRFKPTAATYRHLPRMLRLAWRLNRYDRRLERELPGLEAALEAAAAERLGAMSNTELLDRVDRLMVLARRAAYANIVAPLLMNAYGSLVRRRTGALGIDGATVDPAKGLDGIDAWDPRRALDQLAEAAAALTAEERDRARAAGRLALAGTPALAAFGAAVDAYLGRFGHLGDSGNDFASPRWREQPDVVVRMALDHAAARPAAAQAAATGTLGPDDVLPRARGVSRVILRRLFRRAATFRLLRERVSDRYTFGFGLFRSTFQELGRRLVAAGRLDAAEDVFLLTLDEVRGAVAGLAGALEPAGPADPDVRAIAAARHAEMVAAEDLELPETIIGEDFVPRVRASAAVATIRGVGSARGTHRGIARVVRSLAGWDRVEPGDVLIIPFSDVAWTPLFARAGAVVAESGGMLSHSSIVAREHGIPCVVSAAGALAIPDGSLVHVDGYNGIVTIEQRGMTPGARAARRVGL